MPKYAVLLLLWLATACGSAATEPPAPEPPPESSEIAAALPRVEYVGGPFVTDPTIVTVTFGDDELAPRLTGFGAWVEGSEWWSTVTDGYCTTDGTCVGAVANGPHVALGDLPERVTDASVESRLLSAVRDGRIPVEDGTVILAYLPAGTTLGDAQVSTYCRDRRAYHRALEVDGRRLPIAVTPRCGDVDQLTASASHELVEAVLNPDPNRPAFALGTGSEEVSFTLRGTEPVDACNLLTGDRNRTIVDGFAVSRVWSNAAAETGRDPCVPGNEQAYVALVPEEPVLRVPEPGRATVALTALSSGDVEPWTVEAVDLTGPGRPCLDATLTAEVAAEGDRLELEIRTLRTTPERRCVVGLISRVGATETVWPVAVIQR